MADSQEIFFSGLTEGVQGLNSYLNSDESGEWNLRRVKKFIKSEDFKKRDYVITRKLYLMFDPNQRVSSDILKKQVELYVDLLNEGYDVKANFPEFDGFVETMFKTNITKVSNDKLYALLHAMDRRKDGVSTEAIDEFESKIPVLYTQDIDTMTNRRLSILINYIKDMKYEDLTTEQQSFVIGLFNRCAVKTETSDNNRNKLSTFEWFKDNASNYFSQFNKAFFNVGLYEQSILDEPTKKIRFQYLCKYADLQHDFINEMEELADYHGMSVARLLYRSSEDRVYRTASSCVSKLCVPSFPEYDEGSSLFLKYYLREPREYKTSITSKMLGMFRSMVEYKLKDASYTGTVEDIAKRLSCFVKTKKMNEELMDIVLKYRREDQYAQAYRKAGEWLVDLVHLDELSRIPKYELVPPLDKKILEPVAPAKLASATTQGEGVRTFNPESKNGYTQLSLFELDEDE